MMMFPSGQSPKPIRAHSFSFWWGPKGLAVQHPGTLRGPWMGMRCYVQKSTSIKIFLKQIQKILYPLNKYGKS